MKTRIGWSVAIATVTALVGCSDGDPAPRGSVPDVGGPPTPSGETRSALRTLGDRDAFFVELRGALVAQRGTDEFGYPETDDTAAPGAPAPVGGADADGATDGSTSGDGDFGAEAGGEGTADPATDGGERLEVTETNVQELGVDEQDRVKVSADGTRLYVLKSGFDGVYPVEPLFVEDLETGEPNEIEPGDVAVDPRPGGPGPEFRTTLRILGLDAAATDVTPLRDVELDLGGRSAQGMYLYESDAGSRVVLSSSGGGGYWGYWDTSTAFGGLDSIITRIDVDEPASAAISGRFRIDGQVVSSRRIGKYLFFASRYYPVIPGAEPYALSPEAWQAAVAAADEETLLPGYTDQDSGERTALVEPERCFVAPRPANQEWYSPDIVTLAVIDLDTMALADSECYLGATETLYASPEAVYLATTRWDYGDGGVVILEEEDVGTGTDAGADILPYDPRVETDIHQFDIDGGTLAYRGSGSVRGHLGFDELRRPFRMSAKDGFLRVATINETFDAGFADGGFDDDGSTGGTPGGDGAQGGQSGQGGQGDEQRVSPINVTVLEPDGDGGLRRVAELPNAARPGVIGKPGEQLYASRFLGDRAYLVTFRQTDPLYVVDLADPTDPAVLGELEIEGFSDYLLPIDENHLLGIGRDAVADPTGQGDSRGAFALGVKLSLFDVSDPASPREAESVVVGQRGTNAEALFDHRGITVQRATEEHPTRVSFGIDVAGEASPDARPDPRVGLAWYEWTYTGLHGFDVRGGAGAGIEPRGAMVVERLGSGGRRYGPSAGGDRAVMVNDATYYVHGAEVFAAPWNDLANPSGPR